MMTRRPNLIICVSVVLAVAISSVTVLLLLEMRRDALRRAQDAANNVSLLVERDTARNLEIYDLSIRAVIEELNDSKVRTLDPPIRQKVLFDRSASAKDLGAILVTDDRGNVIIDSRSVPPRRLNVADRSYFTVHRDSARVGLYVSPPFQARLSGGGPMIALSRRLSNPDGSFAGVVVGSLEVNYFRRLFAGMNLGPGGSMALMLTDGTMVMRRPFDENIVGLSLAGTANYTRFAKRPSGEFFGVAAIDGVQRWYTFRHIGNFPLILDVALARDDIYSEWRQRAWLLGSLMALLNLVLVGLAALVTHQLKRRKSVEAELRRLAQTDPLTQLSNRRAFEDAAALEQRGPCGPLSLLMIDVDYFKEFNDVYGHSLGDVALIEVARCIRTSMRRSSDVAARYGGEEFVVLLRDASMEEGADVARRIRAAVERLAMPHVRSPSKTLTVSIGVAGGSHREHVDEASLVDAADAALYEAKRTGRNRVICNMAGAKQMMDEQC